MPEGSIPYPDAHRPSILKQRAQHQIVAPRPRQIHGQHEDLLGELAQQQPGKTDATVQVRLPTEDASDLS